MFKNFPNMQYIVDDKLETNIIKDFYHNVDFVYNYMKKNPSYFKEYIVKDFETPEELSLRFYHDRKYWFLILIINKRADPFFDWILSNDELKQYAEKFVTEEPLEVQQYLAQHPEVLEQLSKSIGFTVTKYTPLDFTDVNNILVRNMIGYYFNKLNEENDERRKIFMPDSNMMRRIYNEYMKISSNF